MKEYSESAGVTLKKYFTATCAKNLKFIFYCTTPNQVTRPTFMRYFWTPIGLSSHFKSPTTYCIPSKKNCNSSGLSMLWALWEGEL